MPAYLKIDTYNKELIEEVSLLSGHSPNVVRDVLESTFLTQTETLFENSSFSIPYVGRIKVVYDGEAFVEGEKEAQVTCLFAASDLLKRIVGDIQDGSSEILSDLLKMKLKSSLQEKLEEK